MITILICQKVGSVKPVQQIYLPSPIFLKKSRKVEKLYLKQL